VELNKAKLHTTPTSIHSEGLRQHARTWRGAQQAANRLLVFLVCIIIIIIIIIIVVVIENRGAAPSPCHAPTTTSSNGSWDGCATRLWTVFATFQEVRHPSCAAGALRAPEDPRRRVE